MVEVGFICHYTSTIWASFRGDLAHVPYGLSPTVPTLATRLWLVLYDLVDTHTRRGTNTTQKLVARIALRILHVRASLKIPSPKPFGKKGMEKRARVRL
jgi:hypothetical protein